MHWYDSNVAVLCVSLRAISAPTAANTCTQSRFDKFATKGHKIRPPTKWGIGTTTLNKRGVEVSKQTGWTSIINNDLNLFVLLCVRRLQQVPTSVPTPGFLSPRPLLQLDGPPTYKITLGVVIVYRIPQPLAVVALRPSISLSSR